MIGFDGKPMSGISSRRIIYSGDFQPILNTGAKSGLFDTNFGFHTIQSTTSVKFRARVEEDEVCKENCSKPIYKYAFFRDECMEICSKMANETPRDTYDLFKLRAQLDVLQPGEMYHVWMGSNGQHEFKSIIAASKDNLVAQLRTFADPETFDTRIEEYSNQKNLFRFKYTVQVTNQTCYILLLKFLHDVYTFTEMRTFVTVRGNKDSFTTNATYDIMSTQDIASSKNLLLICINKLIDILETFVV